MEQYIPWLISGASLIVAYMSFKRAESWRDDDDLKQMTDDLKQLAESILRANIKLDQVFSTTTETRTDIKAMQKHLNEVDMELAVVKRDLKTAFAKIDELKEDINAVH